MWQLSTLHTCLVHVCGGRKKVWHTKMCRRWCIKMLCLAFYDLWSMVYITTDGVDQMSRLLLWYEASWGQITREFVWSVLGDALLWSSPHHYSTQHILHMLQVVVHWCGHETAYQELYLECWPLVWCRSDCRSVSNYCRWNTGQLNIQS